MKRKIFSKLLMGAFLIASVSMFVSCKDYDDDINKNSQDIAALKAQVDALKSSLASDLAAAKAELNTALAAKADKSDVDKALSGKADADDLVALQAKVDALQAKVDAINNWATKDDIESLQTALSVLEGKIPAAYDDTQLRADVEAALKLQEDALNAFKKSVEGAGYLTADDKADLEKKIKDVQDAIANIDPTAGLEEITKAFNDLSKQITDQLTEAIDVMEMLVTKRLTSIVLKPEFYWEGIEAIEAAFLRSPEFKENGEYNFTYTVDWYTEGDKVIKVHVDNVMGWLATDGTILCSETDKTWGTRIAYAKPVATSSGIGTRYSLIDRDGLALAAANDKQLSYVEIAPDVVAQYHINPGNADLTGYKYDFYENLAGVYTRSADGPIKATPIQDKVSVDKGILTVPFSVDYMAVWRYFYKWAFDNDTYTQYFTHNRDANSTSGTYSSGYEPRWDNEYETWVYYNTTYTDQFDDEGNYIGYTVDYDFQGAGRGKVTNFGTSDYWNADGSWAGRFEAPLPFVSLEASKDTTVNSDYAVVVPAILNIIALADKDPDVTLSKNTFVNNHTGGDFSKNPMGEIRNNHLYETVGVEGTIDYYLPGQNQYNSPGAIPSPATHAVVYNGSIDLKPFIETHYAYTTYTKYGQSSVDKIMDEETMKSLGLHYEFKAIDYTVGNEKTSESAHIEEGEEGVFYPRSVTEDGQTIKGQVATKEVIDREPLVRVDLVTEDGKIVRYGYIKLRIVETEVADLDVAIDLGDVYMNCGGYAKLTWSQVENLILAKLNDGKGMSKQEFENNYSFLDQGNHWDMPTNATGALFDTADNNQFWGQRFFYKDGKIAVAANTAVENDAVNTFDYTKWTADNNWFGRVWYTPHDNATSGHSWDEQTNVLIWDLHAWDSKILAADKAAVSAKGDYWRGNMKNVNGITTDALYQKLIAVAGASFESKGLNTNAISTVVRFVNKNTGNFVNVKLTIPVGKLHFAYGDVSNKDWAHWYGFDSTTPGVDDPDAPYWKELDAHINPYKPSNNGYNFLTVTSYTQLLTDNWLDPTQMVVLRDLDNFSKFKANADPELGVIPSVSFIFTVPVKDVNSLNVSANADGEWDVLGASGTKWTLKLGAHNGVDNTAIFAVKKNGVAYGPEEVCYLDDKLVRDGVDIAINNRITYHGLEEAANLYPAATDLVNKMGAYDAQGNELFTIGTGLNNMIDGYYLEDNIDRTFTTYLKLNVSHDLCYDPLIGKNYFNIRVHRPINVVGKEYVWNDRVLADNRLAIKDLVEIVDWNRFAVVAAGSKAIAWRNTYTGIEQPKYDDVYASAGKMKQQNLGIPYEYYGISELAVRYDEIRTDHAKQPAVRQNKYYIVEDIIANTDLAKDLNSMTSWRETGLKTLSLLNADGSVVPFDVAHAYNHSNYNDAAPGNTSFGWLYYNNNASNVQLFHIYVPIAVKYNWGNIAYDYKLDAAGAKLDKDYTQTVWAIITVEGTH